MAKGGSAGLGVRKTLGIILICVAVVMLLPYAWIWLRSGAWSPDTLHDHFPLALPTTGPEILREIARFIFDLPVALFPGLAGLFILWRTYRPPPPI